MDIRQRIKMEERELAKYFPAFKVQDPFRHNRGVIGRMRSNSKRKYTIWLALGDFPYDAPQLYIVEPKYLKSYDGRLLSEIGSGGNRSMHLLNPDPHGNPQICHYNDQFWHIKVSLYKIIMKARFWIEAYEQHLRYGEPIDAYLSHMGG